MKLIVPPRLCADAAVIEKKHTHTHTLLRPRSHSLSLSRSPLSASLTLIGCLLEVTSPLFFACLFPSSSSSSAPSLSPRSQRILTIPLLYTPTTTTTFLSSICCLCPPPPPSTLKFKIICPSLRCSYLKCKKHNNAECVLAHGASPMAPVLPPPAPVQEALC